MVPTTVEPLSKKAFFLDTSTLIHDHESIERFEDNDVYVMVDAIRDLSKRNNGEDELALSARDALNLIDKYREKGSIEKGLVLPGGGRLWVPYRELKSRSKYDNPTILAAIDFQKKNPKQKVVVVSKDPCVRIESAARGVTAEDFESDKTTLFRNHGGILEEGEDAGGILSVRYQREGNRIVRISGGRNRQVIKQDQKFYGINPRNDGQCTAADALLSSAVDIAALTGDAGVGKTMLAMAAGLSMIDMPKGQLFKQLLAARPVFPMGDDLGFMPGTLEEKMMPWMQPIFDNLEFILEQIHGLGAGAIANQERLMKGLIKIQALMHIRGRSLPKRFFIVDEAQNLRPKDVKAIITRGGEGTKIVFTGDLGQIDTRYLDSYSNGLAYLIARYINEPEFCYINLTEGVRSGMATKGARLL